MRFTLTKTFLITCKLEELAYFKWYECGIRCPCCFRRSLERGGLSRREHEEFDLGKIHPSHPSIRQRAVIQRACVRAGPKRAGTRLAEFAGGFA